jgi:rare lipoprotein A (peptidoglycan hydrolase)
MKNFLLFGLLTITVIMPCAAQQPAVAEGIGTRYEAENSALMASHPRLPFGTQLKVTNLENNKQVTVKIGGRILEDSGILVDMASPAADVLGMNRSGKTKLRIEVVPRQARTLVTRSIEREFTQEGTAVRVTEGTQLTAGHSSLPEGSRVRITNKANGRQANATIMYRIRASQARIIELSDALAGRLDIAKSAEVKIETLDDE